MGKKNDTKQQPCESKVLSWNESAKVHQIEGEKILLTYNKNEVGKAHLEALQASASYTLGI